MNLQDLVVGMGCSSAVTCDFSLAGGVRLLDELRCLKVVIDKDKCFLSETFWSASAFFSVLWSL